MLQNSAALGFIDKRKYSRKRHIINIVCEFLLCPECVR